MKAIGLSPSMMFQSPLALTGDGQAMTSLPCIPNLRELQLSPQILSVLDSIEPEVVYSGYDNSQPDMPNQLLNSLNRLCERQLLWIVRWSKSLPGNSFWRTTHISAQRGSLVESEDAQEMYWRCRFCQFNIIIYNHIFYHKTNTFLPRM